MFGFGAKQHVCTACGYNIIGRKPRACPFCGSRAKRIISADAATRRYKVTGREVAPGVTQLRCAPRLGLEHAAYRIDADGGSVWIDCPSAFNSDLPPVDAILFTHKDFVGAANQYRDLWDAEVWMHELDRDRSTVSRNAVTLTFTGNIEKFGIRGLHIGGHSPGFTVYIWRDVLFVCDYVYPPGTAMKLNPHGPASETRQGAARLADILADESGLQTVCGYNYVVDYRSWLGNFTSFV